MQFSIIFFSNLDQCYYHFLMILEKVKSPAIIATKKLKSVEKQMLSIIFQEILTNRKSVKLENQDSNKQEDTENGKAKLDLIFEVTI